VVEVDGSRGGRVALLGSPGARDGEIGVGYGVFWQAFTVDERYLRITYRVVTTDRVWNGELDRYLDTFEVSLNTSPQDVDDDDRRRVGCNTEAEDGVNLTGTIVVTKGLAFCGGHAGPASVVGTLYDTLWRTVTLDLQSFQDDKDKNVTLYLAVWNREYQAPYYNDQGWYNTWAYVDYVESITDVTGTDSP